MLLLVFLFGFFVRESSIKSLGGETLGGVGMDHFGSNSPCHSNANDFIAVPGDLNTAQSCGCWLVGHVWAFIKIN